MATNFIQRGSVWDYTPSGSSVSSGDVVVMGAVLGVALADIADGATGAVQVDGVFSLPKVTAAVVAQGETVVWDVSLGKFDDDQMTPASGDVSAAAVAVEAGTGSQSTIKVLLTPGSGTVT